MLLHTPPGLAAFIFFAMIEAHLLRFTGRTLFVNFKG
jgi:hypothetical protein